MDSPDIFPHWSWRVPGIQSSSNIPALPSAGALRCGSQPFYLQQEGRCLEGSIPHLQVPGPALLSLHAPSSHQFPYHPAGGTLPPTKQPSVQLRYGHLSQNRRAMKQPWQSLNAWHHAAPL